MPVQVVFETPKLADLAARIDADAHTSSSRLSLLHNGGSAAPVYCWPGLGGYPMNLRLLGSKAGIDRPFYGIHAQGINPGETPFHTIRDMAAADIAEIQDVQPDGPYTLWGYSFGARIAFEVASQLEQRGQRVQNLVMICPGNPKVRTAGAHLHGRKATYGNPAYVAILYSVFAGTAHGPTVERCLRVTQDEDNFIAHVLDSLPSLDEDTIRRIIRVVEQTYEFEYTFHELAQRRINAPITILKASGDDYSFLDAASDFSVAR
jgi:thioesterase domain-containing protein